MPNEILLLAGTAATIGFVHTVSGPDHYIPFIALARARGWNGVKTAGVTFLCGLGHILSSVILGLVGVALGTAAFRLEALESLRGELAAWFLIAFGFTYLVWGVYRAIRQRPHEHLHVHGKGDIHLHPHKHTTEHIHLHDVQTDTVTPWVLFLIFVFGPCEPLIPLLMFPAFAHDTASVVMVASVFGLATIFTMLAIVMTAFYGLSRLRLHGFERYSHALAGLAILLCGGAIKFLGL